MGYSVGGFAAWDPSGDRYDDCLWYDLEQISPLGPGSEMFDFTLPTGLSVACVEPLREYRLRYKEEGCEVDFTWRAVRPPFSAAVTGQPGAVGPPPLRMAARSGG